ncbi:helix-turn-helix domain-containing protein [Solirubrobacter ginsenosidimutans]|uniref:Helix-turn-helix domain-containing protein n=1 Tax=Solirubrobacter ginsenosidimutans TaxID=490573 RepID=A0A9X3N250_9ACTN|nr:helix-turn-helix domain-containing protein [Solirubrobacter ginsenosidimutans]MDA0167079.1 helix-turn-helix domain-containing protein [Solirubrobacter ginsenosidimutans]
MSDRIAAIAHPLRDRVLFEYQRGPVSPSEVARRTGLPLNVVGYHTGVLERHDCVELVRSERRGGALTRYYRATVAQDIEDERWAEVPAPLRRRFVLETLARASDEARRAALAGGFDGPHGHLARFPAALDHDAVLAAGELLRRTAERLVAIEADARRRSQPRDGYRVVLMGFAPVERAGPAATDR